MAADAELKSPTSIKEPPPILAFLHDARFPEELQRMVDLVTKMRPHVRALNDFNALVVALRTTRRPLLGELADALTGAVVAAVNCYPQNVRGAILVILNNPRNPCRAEVFAEVFSDNIEVVGLVRILMQSPAHVTEAVRLKDLWLLG